MWVTLLSLIVAQEASTGNPATDITNILLQAGLAGAFIVCMITGLVSPKTTTDAKNAQIQMLTEQLSTVTAQRDRMIENYETQVIPVLTQLNNELVPAMKRSADVLSGHSDEIEDLKVEIRRATDTALLRGVPDTRAHRDKDAG